MTLSDELAAIAEEAAAYAEPGEHVSGVLAAEPAAGGRVYLCSFDGGAQRRWLVLDGTAAPVRDRALVREAVSIAAMCEIADETAGGGQLDELRDELVTLRAADAPEGIDEAEAAARELERVLGTPPRVASPLYLDRVGDATRRLERALGASVSSPFGNAMQAALAAVDELARDVEAAYKLELR